MQMHERDENGTQEAEAELFSSTLGDTTIELVQARILHTLRIYPRLNMSMLQIGVGTGFPPAIWHPALDELVRKGRVIRSTFTTTNPVSRREQTYTVITLAPVEAEAA